MLVGRRFNLNQEGLPRRLVGNKAFALREANSISMVNTTYDLLFLSKSDNP